MKYIFLLTVLLPLGTTTLRAQPPDSIYSAVAQMPEFPGGRASLMKYLAQHLKYPRLATEEGTQTSLCVTFIITKEGRAVKPQVRNPKGTAWERGVKKLILNMPLWKPGMQDGRPVHVRYVLPISCIKLQE